MSCGISVTQAHPPAPRPPRRPPPDERPQPATAPRQVWCVDGRVVTDAPRVTTTPASDVMGGRRARWHGSAADARRCALAWTGSASRASRRDGISTPVEHFRHRRAARPVHPPPPHRLHAVHGRRQQAMWGRRRAWVCMWHGMCVL
jgi:hypothetical protein